MYNFAEKSHNAIFKYQDFNITFRQIRQGDIVYCDPPYVPLTDTSSFTAYSKKKIQHRATQEISTKCRSVTNKRHTMYSIKS